MGHLIEYIAAVSETRVRKWIKTLRGCAMPGGGWEGTLPGGGTFWAYSTDRATNFVLSAKYTWLFNSDPATLEFTRRFEAEFWRHVAPVPLLRFDEFLCMRWELETGAEWFDFPDPFDAAVAWLADKEPTHCQLLTPPGTPKQMA